MPVIGTPNKIQGRITARDSYEVVRNTVKCTAVERLSVEGMVSFNADDATRKMVGGTIQKLSGLSQESCGELISSKKNRKLAERDCSIRERLAKAGKQMMKEGGGTRQWSLNSCLLTGSLALIAWRGHKGRFCPVVESLTLNLKLIQQQFRAIIILRS